MVFVEARVIFPRVLYILCLTLFKSSESTSLSCIWHKFLRSVLLGRSDISSTDFRLQITWKIVRRAAFFLHGLWSWESHVFLFAISSRQCVWLSSTISYKIATICHHSKEFTLSCIYLNLSKNTHSFPLFLSLWTSDMERWSTQLKLNKLFWDASQSTTKDQHYLTKYWP